MVNFGSFTYWTQIAFLGSHAQSNASTSLADIVPRREVVYVGGAYTNITVCFTSPMPPLSDQPPLPIVPLPKHNKATQHLTHTAGSRHQYHLHRPHRPNLRRETHPPSPAPSFAGSPPPATHHLHRRRRPNRHQFPVHARRPSRLGGLLPEQRPHRVPLRPAGARPLRVAAQQRRGAFRHHWPAERRVGHFYGHRAQWRTVAPGEAAHAVAGDRAYGRSGV